MIRLLVAGLGLLGGLLLGTPGTRGQDTPIRPGTTVGPHPRLLLTTADEARVREAIRRDSGLAAVHQTILTECNAMLGLPPVERIQIGRRLLDKSREALRRIFFLAYAWRSTRQPVYRERAERELLAIAAFSDWNPSHFLDVAEMTLAAAIGYDWLYADLPETSRAAVRTAILEKGLAPSLDARHNGWLQLDNNWNQVCNAGISYGALAVYESMPDTARHLLNRAIQSVRIPMRVYEPDGAYPEGYNYWGYGTGFNVLLISALERALGSQFGLADGPGFHQTAAYMLHMVGPSGQSFNYSDAGRGTEIQPAQFWFASWLDDPSLTWFEHRQLAGPQPRPYRHERLLPTVLIWGSWLGGQPSPTPRATSWVGQGETPVALLRTSWTAPRALFMGLKGGSPGVSHAHMDVGSFVLDADGLRWAIDLGMQEYNSLESKGLQIWGRNQQAQRWSVFRYRNQAHNTLTVNDSLQRVTGKAPIEAGTANPAFRYAITDLSGVYAGQLAQARRGIALVDEAYAQVRDEVQATDSPASVRWAMLTPATVTITAPNRAELRQGGKTLVLEVVEPAGVQLTSWSADPPHDYDAPNPDVRFVGFALQVPAGQRSTLSVRLVPGSAAGRAPKPIRPLGEWGR
ncbi:hypothetical protein GCM10027578_39450 [Spirosoma luteolum]